MSQAAPLIEYFLPVDARMLPETERRIRLQVRSCLALALIALPLAITNYWMEGRVGPTSISFVIGIPLMLMNAFLLRKGLGPSIAGALITIELMAALTSMTYFNGGIHAAALVWMIPVPLLAQFLVGPRFALLTAIITAAEVIGFFVTYRLGIVLPSTFSSDENVIWHVFGTATSAIFVALLGWYFDSERKRADLLTRRSEERLRMVVANAGVTLFSTDIAGSIILSAGNMQSEIPASIFTVFPPEHQGTLRSALAGDSSHFEFVMAERCFEAWLAPTLDSSAVVNGATCLIVDITSRKRLEGKIAVSERMASLGTLAAGIGHEINNPLTYILSNTNFVLDELKDIDSENRGRMQSALVDALDGMDQIRRIVGELRTFTRSEEHTEVSALAPVDLRPIIERALILAGNQIRHRAQLVTEYGDIPPVRGSAGSLGQVILNLVLNAAQAIDEGSQDDNEIRIATYCERDLVVIEVSDTGAGIAPAHINRVFEPFFTTKTVTGTGLGLSISHQIVESMNGRIEVSARPSGGTCFRVLLPAAEAPAVAALATQSLEAPPVEPANILVIDDLPALLKSVKRMLRPHNVITVTSGEEALALLEKQEFELILCDIMMPHMTGIDVFNAIKEKFCGMESRIVFMTGGVFTSTVESFFVDTAIPCLDKPFTPKEVNSFVARHLRPSAT